MAGCQRVKEDTSNNSHLQWTDVKLESCVQPDCLVVLSLSIGSICRKLLFTLQALVWKSSSTSAEESFLANTLSRCVVWHFEIVTSCQELAFNLANFSGIEKNVLLKSVSTGSSLVVPDWVQHGWWNMFPPAFVAEMSQASHGKKQQFPL